MRLSLKAKPPSLVVEESHYEQNDPNIVEKSKSKAETATVHAGKEDQSHRHILIGGEVHCLGNSLPL